METEKLLGLNYIENIIRDNSAMNYAVEMLRLEKENCVLHVLNTSTGKTTEKKVNYTEYMRQTWNNSTDATLSDCETISFLSKLNQYSKYLSMYHGFRTSGSEFLLDKKDKIVYFKYGTSNNNGSTRFYVHYNPLNKDVLEMSMNINHINENEHYVLYDNERKAIEELNNIIKVK